MRELSIATNNDRESVTSQPYIFILRVATPRPIDGNHVRDDDVTEIYRHLKEKEKKSRIE